MQTKLFRRDFTLVVIGQIISLFGNAILRFALPLYLLRETDLQHYLVLLLPAPLLQWSFFLWSAAYWLTV